ncbi:hypothetical protein M6B38_352660 [Iris pallida]|uniref:Uncharacterized protein n=1 Tax=Iris pallida TaxID=29817 RepID=A0AAX6GQ38_IRIPA|nr:hypothetical protein M6B38_352660 [Iris pallida]
MLSKPSSRGLQLMKAIDLDVRSFCLIFKGDCNGGNLGWCQLDIRPQEAQ